MVMDKPHDKYYKKIEHICSWKTWNKKEIRWYIRMNYIITMGTNSTKRKKRGMQVEQRTRQKNYQIMLVLLL